MHPSPGAASSHTKRQSALIRKWHWWQEGLLLSLLAGGDSCLQDLVISINIEGN